MTVESVTLLRAVDGAVLTKRIRRALDGALTIEGYDDSFRFAVSEVPVSSLLDLGPLLAGLERISDRCIIRGRPLPGINRARCRRLLYPVLDDDGREIAATFEPAARRWLALDFDDLPTPVWSADDLARRRAAIERDRAEQYASSAWPDDPAELIEPDLAGDEDPAPIDPVRDWALAVRAAVSTLPPEFHGASAWWQMTSSAGIKPGIRVRLFYWLDRPVSDAECKRWLAAAPVDRALYSPVQVHYVAAPIFDDPDDDPVPQRSGWWWRHDNVVTVPELPEPPAPEPVTVAAWQPVRVAPGEHRETAQACLARGELTDWEREFCGKVAALATITTAQAETLAKIADPRPAKARRYADATLRGVAAASAGTRHQTLMAAATRLYSLADIGLLDHGETTRALLAAGEAALSGPERQQRATRQGGRASELERAADWARARARSSPDLPEGFRR